MVIDVEFPEPGPAPFTTIAWRLDREYARWIEGVHGWDEEDLQVAVGEAEGPWTECSRAALVAHIHRELLHHFAEVALLRDLYARRG